MRRYLRYLGNLPFHPADSASIRADMTYPHDLVYSRYALSKGKCLYINPLERVLME